MNVLVSDPLIISPLQAFRCTPHTPASGCLQSTEGLSTAMLRYILRCRDCLLIVTAVIMPGAHRSARVSHFCITQIAVKQGSRLVLAAQSTTFVFMLQHFWLVFPLVWVSPLLLARVVSMSTGAGRDPGQVCVLHAGLRGCLKRCVRVWEKVNVRFFFLAATVKHPVVH